MLDVPPPLEELAGELARAEEAGDHDRAYAVRSRIAEGFPGDEAGTCARYKMGLHRLFRARDLVGAAQLFEEAAEGGHAFWSDAARTSFGLCLTRMGRAQKGMLELRKVAYAAAPSPHAPVALGFLEVLLLEGGQASEAARVRQTRVQLLEAEVAREPPAPPAELAHHLHQLGLALFDQGERGRAREMWQRGLALGSEAVGAEVLADLAAALARPL